MSDATLPPPRSSSLPPATEAGSRSDSSSGEGDFDTSLSQSSFSKEEEGAGDSETRVDGKQKRKRTSPPDQAILEAEYKQNPKPNKAARAEIVEKVSLNEKEVQIWFQNRRQINRRKSRPLLPHEIAAFGLRGMAALSSDPAQLVALSSSQSTEESGQISRIEAASSHVEEPSTSQIEIPVPQDSEVSAQITEKSGEVEAVAKPSIPPPPASLKRQSSSGISVNEGSSSVFKSFTSTPGYLSNRWNPVTSSFSTPSFSQSATSITPTISQTQLSKSCPGRLSDISTTSSHVRLSMSLDGQAELVSTSPSPPHTHEEGPSSSSGSFIPQKRMRTLQRSHSALPFASQVSSLTAGAPFVPRLATGRSRDARTWQFCCDGDARDELTTQAERESNGSAVAAISLIRSTSNSALKSNTNKRNAPAAKQDPSKHGKKPKLGRVQSSLARLQYPGKENKQASGYGKDDLMRSPSGDSDKENWLPGESTGNRRRRPLLSAPTDKVGPRTILGDSHKVPTHATNFGGRNQKRKSADVGSNIFEDQQNNGEGGEDVENFMRGEVSPSKKGDLDCIQGLLSLSQGNWR